MRASSARPIEGATWVDPPPVCSRRLWTRATTAFGSPSRMEDAGTFGRWSPERIREFLAGRRCAEAALRDAGAASLDVKVGPRREPLWPSGYVGSITHSRSFAFAAVGRSTEVASVGVDSEPILDLVSLASVASLTFHPAERERVAGRLDLATAVFSAKESLFKCLYPLVRVFFDYLDAHIVSLDVLDGRGVCILALQRDLGSRFAQGSTFLVRIAVEEGHVHTGVELSP